MRDFVVRDGKAFNRPDGKRWYVEPVVTGTPWDPMLCAWYYTREQARDGVRIRRSQSELIAAYGKFLDRNTL